MSFTALATPKAADAAAAESSPLAAKDEVEQQQQQGGEPTSIHAEAWVQAIVAAPGGSVLVHLSRRSVHWASSR